MYYFNPYVLAHNPWVSAPNSFVIAAGGIPQYKLAGSQNFAGPDTMTWPGVLRMHGFELRGEGGEGNSKASFFS